MSKRDYNKEYQDNTRKYAYNFDYTLRDFMIRTFKPHLPEGRCLEMGCYLGEFTKKLISLYDDVTVIEASDELIEKAKKNVGAKVKFIHSMFEDYDGDEKFDAIFFMHTLEHIDDPIAVLKIVNSCLTDNGKLFLVVPNANALSRQIAVKMGLVDYNAAIIESERLIGHVKTYSLDTLENDVLKSGLKVYMRGGVFVKTLSGSQYDQALQSGVINDAYLEGCYQLGTLFPDLCSSIYIICEKGN